MHRCGWGWWGVAAIRTSVKNQEMAGGKGDLGDIGENGEVADEIELIISPLLAGDFCRQPPTPCSSTRPPVPFSVPPPPVSVHLRARFSVSWLSLNAFCRKTLRKRRRIGVAVIPGAEWSARVFTVDYYLLRRVGGGEFKRWRRLLKPSSGRLFWRGVR